MHPDFSGGVSLRSEGFSELEMMFSFTTYFPKEFDK